MATGDQADFVARLRAVLPIGWFTPPTSPDPSDVYLSAPGQSGFLQDPSGDYLSIPYTPAPSPTPVLDAVLGGAAACLSWAYALLAYVKKQTRIATATGVWLDLIAADFFGSTIQRGANESDAKFSARIRANLLTEKATRASVIAALLALTGRMPKVFEPANTGDTGGYCNGTTAWSGMAYGYAGGWGSLALPFQAFITAYRPATGGISNVSGYYAGSGWAGGGYGSGALEYVSSDMIEGQVTDAEIYAAVEAVQPAGSIMWTQIQS